jgi:hypothetical protein
MILWDTSGWQQCWRLTGGWITALFIGVLWHDGIGLLVLGIVYIGH